MTLDQSIVTPCYVYDLALLRQTLDTIISASAGMPARVHYALKANPDPRIVAEVAQRGFGADCVSIGEVRHAIACGISADKCVYSGVGKTDPEIIEAINLGIECFNVESLEELQIISHLASQNGKVAPIALRINPHIDAHTHHYITTGLAENKFGIDVSLFDQALHLATTLPGLRFRGIHCHIGSQILTNEPYALLCTRINDLVARVRQAGASVDYINVGGGLGVDYEEPVTNPIADFQGFFDTLRQGLNVPAGALVHCELGRSIVAQCGTILSRVIYVKEGLERHFVIIDAGMNNLIRPALYQAVHRIDNLSAPNGTPTATYDIVGPVCETADTFAEGYVLPRTRRGDILAIRSAGAYAQSMASQYNLRQPAAVVYTEDEYILK